jgi:hypothetical protein
MDSWIIPRRRVSLISEVIAEAGIAAGIARLRRTITEEETS